MNVLIYNLGYNRYSGGVYYIDGLACALALQGHNVTLLSDAPNISSFNLNFPNLEKVISNDFTPPDKHYDVVLSIHQHPMVKASVYAKSHGIPFIPIVFELPNYARHYIPEWHIANDAMWEYIKEPLRNASSILCLSEQCVKYIYEFVPETRAKKIYFNAGIINNHVAGRIYNSGKSNVCAKHVCWIGLRGKNKNVQDLISAVAMAGSKGWAINYITPEHDNLADSLAMKIGVSLNMVVNPDDIKKFEIINNSDIIVSTSRFEGGICMSILEGMYMGKPVISYELPSQRDICGELITHIPANIEELSKALANAPTFTFAERNHKFIEDNFTIEAVGKNMNNMLSEVI